MAEPPVTIHIRRNADGVVQLMQEDQCLYGMRAPVKKVGAADWAKITSDTLQEPQRRYGSASELHAVMKDEVKRALEPSERALTALITATGSHVTVGTLAAELEGHVDTSLYEECLATWGPEPEEIPVTDEMIAAGWQTWQLRDHPCSPMAAIYRAMAAVAPVELYGQAERQLDAAIVRVADLEDENAELYADAALLLARNQLLTAKLATFGPVTPADLPDPPRRADGTLAPQPRRLPGVAELPPEKRVGG